MFRGLGVSGRCSERFGLCLDPLGRCSILSSVLGGVPPSLNPSGRHAPGALRLAHRFVRCARREAPASASGQGTPRSHLAPGELRPEVGCALEGSTHTGISRRRFSETGAPCPAGELGAKQTPQENEPQMTDTKPQTTVKHLKAFKGDAKTYLKDTL